MTRDQLLAKGESLLGEREFEALRSLASSPSSRLSPQAAAQFFALFLQGYTLEAIAQQNPNLGSFGLGLLARARVEYDWDAERDTYVRSLMNSVRTSAEKITLEGIQFASDGMAAYHKLIGGRFRQYLQTGDVHHLGDLKDMSFKMYKELVELMQKLTGQDKSDQPIEVMVRQEDPLPAGNMPVLPDRALTLAEAAGALEMLTKDKDKS